jgi:hypothetical protein
MGDVVDLNGNRDEEESLTAQTIMEAGVERCKNEEIEQVLVIYKRKDGDLFVSGNGGSLPETVFQLEIVKHKLLEEHGGHFG